MAIVPISSDASPGGSLGVTAVPSKMAAATMKPKPAARGYLKYQGKENEAADAQEYQLYIIAGANKRANSQLLKGDSRQRQELAQQVDKVWQGALRLIKKYFDRTAKSKDIEAGIGRLEITVKNGRKYGQADFYGKIKECILKTHPNATNLAMDFTDMSVRFQENGQIVEITKEHLPQEVADIMTFLVAWQDAHEAAMALLGVRRWHARLSEESNRPVHGKTPFRFDTPNANWDHFRSKSIDDFTERRLQVLLAELPEDQRADAETMIRNTGRFINNFVTTLNTKINQKQEALEGLQDASQKEKLKKEIELLKKLKKQAEDQSQRSAEEIAKGERGIDLDAVFTAMAFWRSSDPAKITQEHLTEAAQLTTNASLSIFEKTRGIDKKLWRTPADYWRGDVPDKDDLISMAKQTGDLFFHSDLDYLLRFDESGARYMVRPCMEEFVVYNMMRLNDANHIPDLSSLGLPPLDPDFQAELRAIITEARVNTLQG